MRYLVALAILAVGILGGVAAAEAALSVSPSRVVLQGKPKQRLVGYFKLENTGDSVLEVSVEPEDWSSGISGSRGRVEWLKVRPRQLDLKPGKHARVKYVIRVPKDAEGELRTQVFFTTEQEGEENSVPLRSRLGTIIYVGVEGTERIDGAITGVSAYYKPSKPHIKKPDRLDLAIDITNRSNVHIVPEGEVIVRREDGRKEATVKLRSGWGLLPREKDTYHAIGHGIHLAPGRYLMEVNLFIGGDLRKPTTVSKFIPAVVSEEGKLELIAEEIPEP